MAKEKNKFYLTALLILAVVFALVYFGINLTSNLGKSKSQVTLEEAATDADFIFLCVPVGLLELYVDKLLHMRLKPGCIISDVGSTKASISAYAAAHMRPDVFFIGGHPMAGSERSGVEVAASHLRENAFYLPPILLQDPPFPRAAPLPHWFCGEFRISGRQPWPSLLRLAARSG